MGKYKHLSTQFHSCCLDEKWEDMEEYEGYYQISSCGRVMSLERLSMSGKKLKKIILKSSLRSSGSGRAYAQVVLNKNCVTKSFSIRRLVAIAFIPNENNFPIVMGKNKNLIDDHSKNLKWGTGKDLVLRGEASPRSKITTRIALSIKKMRDRGLSAKNIANKLEINKSTVGSVYYNNSWKHV